MDTLDNVTQLHELDNGSLQASGEQWQQLTMQLHQDFSRPADTPITQLVIAGMGGSALASGLAEDWLELPVPVKIVRDYTLPASVGEQTLVICSSFSGNTEETLSCAHAALERGATVAVTAGGGKLLELAAAEQLNYVQLPKVAQPRMGVFANLLAIVTICEFYGLVEAEKITELRSQADWLKTQSAVWSPEQPTESNLAKQIAQRCFNTTPVVFSSTKMAAVAYKWKISLNETGKNVAFYNVLPEFDHNELTGWTSHPTDKPFTPLQLRSNLDHPQINKRFTIVERLLAGRMPTPLNIELAGETLLQKMLWGCVLADFTSIYLALLNGADPVTPTLVEELKKEL